MRRPVALGVMIVAALVFSSGIVQPGQLSAYNGSLDLSPIIAKGLTGLTWDGKEFLGSYGINNVPLVNISLDGQKVTRFAPNFSGKDEVYLAQSSGKAGFSANYLYANFDPSIYELDPTGTHVRVFSTPPGSSRISYVAFDTVGTWGYKLLALDDNGLLWSIASNGTGTVVQNFSNFGRGPLLKPEGIAIAPLSFGALGGFLFITLEGAERILAISPNDTSQVLTMFHFTNEEPERVLQIPPQSDLYVAEFDTGSIYRMPAANFSSYSNSLVVITEGENEPFGSFNILQPSGKNVTLTRISTVPKAPHFEGVAFIPSSASVAWSQTSSLQTTTVSSPTFVYGGQQTGASALNLLLLGGAIVVGVVLAAAIAFRRRPARG